jgi:hypothetical protein
LLSLVLAGSTADVASAKPDMVITENTIDRANCLLTMMNSAQVPGSRAKSRKRI